MCDKVKYQSLKRARNAAYAIKAKGYIPARDSLNPYWCASCKVWHLSKQSGSKYSFY